MVSRRRQVLDAAAPMFARSGFHGVSVDELGAAVGISGPALYRHFAGKEAILSALLLDISQRLLDGGRARVAANPGAPEALQALIDGHVEFALTEPALITLQERDLDAVPEAARREVRSLQRRYVDLWADAIVAVTRAERPVALAGAHAVFGLLNSTPHSARLPRQAMATVLRSTAWAALTALPGSPHREACAVRPTLLRMADGDVQVQLRSVVFDCADPTRLAGFYGELLGGTVDTSDPAWCEVHVDGLPVKLAFQLVPGHLPPEWPEGRPQQLHLDITVPDIAAASTRAVSLGARVLDGPVDEGGSMFQVHADPAGHPFCFCQDR